MGGVAVPIAGSGGSVGVAMPRVSVAAGGRFCRPRGLPTWVKVRSRGFRGRRLATGLATHRQELMPEQKLVVPACPRRGNGHWWRFDRERSTGDCQADVCQACALVRLTSYRTGQVVRYEGADDGG